MMRCRSGGCRPRRWRWWSERDLAIRAFVPEDYREGSDIARLIPSPLSLLAPSGKGLAVGRVKRKAPALSRRLVSRRAPGTQGQAAARRWRGSRASSPAPKAGRRRLNPVDAETRRAPPPLLYDLTELQRHANRLYGFSAQTTLDHRPEAV
jgi:DNA topoisomerase-3